MFKSHAQTLLRPDSDVERSYVNTTAECSLVDRLKIMGIVAAQNPVDRRPKIINPLANPIWLRTIALYCRGGSDFATNRSEERRASLWTALLNDFCLRCASENVPPFDPALVGKQAKNEAETALGVHRALLTNRVDRLGFLAKLKFVRIDRQVGIELERNRKGFPSLIFSAQAECKSIGEPEQFLMDLADGPWRRSGNRMHFNTNDKNASLVVDSELPRFRVTATLREPMIWLPGSSVADRGLVEVDSMISTLHEHLWMRVLRQNRFETIRPHSILF